MVIPYQYIGSTYESHLQGSRNPRRKKERKNGTGRLSRKVGKELPPYAA
jgi:hypothetical protein